MRVGLLCGGWSYESHLCAYPAIYKSLERLGHKVVAIDTSDKSLAQTLLSSKPDVAFLASHGYYHEDGRLQSICDWIDLPYTGPNHFSSAICMNKILFKHIAERYSYQPPFELLRDLESLVSYRELVKRFDSEKIILKPLLSGASVGITVVECENEYSKLAPQVIHAYGETLAEPLIQGARELSLVAHDFDGKVDVLEICELVTHGKVFDFDMKNGFLPIGKKVPADLPDKKTQELKSTIRDVYTDLGLESVVRLDVMLLPSGKFYALEVNTLPGLMPQSVVPSAFAYIGVGYDQVINKILMRAFGRRRFYVGKQTTGQPKLSEQVAM